MIRKLIFIGLIIGVSFIFIRESTTPKKFKVNQCVIAKNEEGIRKISKVKKFRYEYKLFLNGKYLDKTFIMNYKDFDKKMEEVQCPK